MTPEEDRISTDTATESRAEFTEKMESRLDELANRFQEMELDQLRKGEMKARKKLEKAKDWVDGNRARFEKELKRARKASEGAWSEVREGLENAQAEFEAAIDRARREFDGEDTSVDPDESKD